MSKWDWIVPPASDRQCFSGCSVVSIKERILTYGTYTTEMAPNFDSFILHDLWHSRQSHLIALWPVLHLQWPYFPSDWMADQVASQVVLRLLQQFLAYNMILWNNVSKPWFWDWNWLTLWTMSWFLFYTDSHYKPFYPNQGRRMTQQMLVSDLLSQNYIISPESTLIRPPLGLRNINIMIHVKIIYKYKSATIEEQQKSWEPFEKHKVLFGLLWRLLARFIEHQKPYIWDSKLLAMGRSDSILIVKKDASHDWQGSRQECTVSTI